MASQGEANELLEVARALISSHGESKADTVVRFNKLATLLAGKSFQGESFDLDMVVNASLEVLTAPRTSLVLKIETLTALGRLLFEHGAHCSRLFVRLLNCLLPLASVRNPELDLLRLSMHCIGNLSMKAGSRMQSHYPAMYGVVYAVLGKFTQAHKEDLASLKVLSATLRTMHFVVSEGKGVHTRDLQHLVESFRKLSFFGFTTSVSTPSTPAGRSVRPATAPAPTVGRDVKEAGDKLEGLSTGDPDSDGGEFRTSGSDSEGENGNALSQRRTEISVRCYALNCIHALSVSSGKALHPHWPQLLPDRHALSRRPIAPSLLTLLLFDTAPRVRTSAASAVAAMLEGGKQLLTSAEDPVSSKAAFTAHSTTLASVCHELHSALLSSCTNELSPQVLVQVLKTLSILMTVTPYERLRTGLLSKVAAVLEGMIVSGDPNIRCAALGSLKAVFSTKKGFEEIFDVITPTPSAKPSRLFAKIIAGAGESETVTEARCEALWAISRVARSYNDTFRCYWKDISSLVKSSASHVDPNVRAQGILVIEECAKAIASSFGGLDVDEDDQPVSKTAVVQTFKETGQVVPGATWWHEVLESFLPTAIADESAVVRMHACQCYSYLSDEIFAPLPSRLRTMCVTFLLSTASDESEKVCAATCKALGVFVMLPSMKEYEEFIHDVAAVLQTVLSEESRYPALRIRGMWLLANVCDVLATRFTSDPIEVTEFSTRGSFEAMLSTLVSLSLAGLKESDKVKSNAVRALGNITRLELLHKAHPEMMETIVTSLVSLVRAGTVKVRWNACYAALYLFANKSVSLSTASWAPSLFDALICALNDCVNYKVRINAVSALLVPSTYADYGRSFAPIMTAVVNSLENIEKMSDFRQFQYKNNLQEQLVILLLHLAELSATDDGIGAKEVLDQKSATINMYIDQYEKGLIKKLEEGGAESPRLPESYLTKLQALGDYFNRIADAGTPLQILGDFYSSRGRDADSMGGASKD